LDAPCGDLNWMQHVSLNGVRYIGGDIVSELIDNNKRRFAQKGLELLVLDITKDNLPNVDAILVRDCLVHFSYSDIHLFLQNLKSSKIKYLITTSFSNTWYNYNISSGNWRALNLQKKPFSFPKPIHVIVENCTDGYGQFPDKSLMIWEIQNLPI